MKRILFLAAGAVLLTATMAMAGPGKGNSAGGKDSAGRSGDAGKSAGKGKNANSNPAADYPAGAAGIALFNIFDVKPKREESAPPEHSLPEAKPFTLY